MTEERWLPVADWEGAYEVSDMGRVRSLERVVPRRGHGGQRRVPAKFLTPSPNDKGVRAVGLGSGGHKTIRKQVGRLVLETFIGPCPPGLECCHWDDDPANNRLENLRWDTRQANKFDEVRNGRNFYLKKTHCPNGHEYTPENTRMVNRKDRRPTRQCRTCAHAQQRRFWNKH